jgi:hypothetical protein
MKKFVAILLTLIMAVSIMFPVIGPAAHAADEYSSVCAGDETPACFDPCEFYLESDAPDEYVFQYGAGETVRINYTIHGVSDADEYRIACSGENEKEIYLHL